MARQILDGVLELAFPRALVHAYLVRADVLTLIDTGTPGASDRVIRALRGTEHARDLGRIVLTHRHGDHAGNAAELARASGAEVLASPADAAYIRDGSDQPRPQPATRLGRVMVPYVKVALPWHVDPVPVREELTDGAQVGPFQIIATPGHTAGHVSVLWPERGILFAADAAANLTGVGPHPAADDPATARESFARLAELDFEAVCFGHGRAITRDAAAQFRAAR